MIELIGFQEEKIEQRYKTEPTAVLAGNGPFWKNISQTITSFLKLEVGSKNYFQRFYHFVSFRTTGW